MKNIYDYFGICKKYVTLLDLRMPKFPDGHTSKVLSNSRNTVQAFTFTFGNEYRNMDARHLHKKAVCSYLRLLSKCRTELFIKINSEYDKQNVLHFHLILAGPIYWLGKLTAFHRKTYGHTFPSNLKTLHIWNDYISGQKTKTHFVQNVFKPILITTINKKLHYCKIPIRLM